VSSKVRIECAVRQRYLVPAGLPMDHLQLDWRDIVSPDVSLLEIVVRGSVLYLVVTALLRLTLRRSTGEVGTIDFVLILLIANASTNAMTGGSTAILDAVILILTIAAWNYGLNALGYYVPAIERLMLPPPLAVIRDGALVPRNMRREFLSRNELLAELREHGITSIDEVQAAFIEADGTISIIPYQDDKKPGTMAPRPRQDID
jgi:uncharacterized membrane protein YcaP (DUF421 family)